MIPCCVFTLFMITFRNFFLESFSGPQQKSPVIVSRLLSSKGNKLKHLDILGDGEQERVI